MKIYRILKYLLAITAVALFILLLTGLYGSAQAADPTWTAKYWNNRALNGSPVLQRQENQINYDWGSGSPQPGTVNTDNFSASWERSINFPGGAVTFTATVDDGIRVWVDGTLIIDDWQESAVRSISRQINLTAGDHFVRVHYFEAGSNAVAKLTWSTQGGGNVPPTPRWRGEYYNNIGLSGSPAFVREDAIIDFDWGVGSPGSGVAADNFSVRWTNTLPLQSGKYRFTAIADDGVRLWVNGQLIINEWHDAYEGTYQAEVNVPGSSAEVRMEYYENVGGARAVLQWLRVGNSDSGSWYGEYYNNKTLSGSPALTRNENSVDFNWGSGSPAGGIINNDNFSARWTNNISLSTGSYRFTATSDDGVRVWVNNQLIIDAWSDHAPTAYNGQINLSGGSIPVRVEYYESTGNAQVSLYWVLSSAEPPPNPTPTPVPGPSPNPTPVPGSGQIVGVVVSPRLNVRTGPGLQYGVIAQLNQGNTVVLTGYRASVGWWVMINWQGGTAWVSGHPGYLSINVPHSSLTIWTGGTTPPPGTGGLPPGPTAIVWNCNYLNVRSSPVVGNNVVTVIPAGMVVGVLGRNSSSTWTKIQLPNGIIGWSSTNYLDESVPINTLPIVQ